MGFTMIQGFRLLLPVQRVVSRYVHLNDVCRDTVIVANEIVSEPGS